MAPQGYFPGSVRCMLLAGFTIEELRALPSSLSAECRASLLSVYGALTSPLRASV